MKRRTFFGKALAVLAAPFVVKCGLVVPEHPNVQLRRAIIEMDKATFDGGFLDFNAAYGRAVRAAGKFVFKDVDRFVQQNFIHYARHRGFCSGKPRQRISHRQSRQPS